MRSAWQFCRREPALAAVIILTLAVGIAANTAIFSVVNGVLLQPLGYRQPGRLMALAEFAPRLAKQYPEIPVNAPAYLAWKKQAQAFSGMALVTQGRMDLSGGGRPLALDAAEVTPGLFGVLGVRPSLGRDFLPQANQKGHQYVVILTDGLWRSRFGADPQIIGRAITLDGHAYTVVGVLPRSFQFPTGYELNGVVNLGAGARLFVPHVFTQGDLDGGNFNFAAIGRLRPGFTPRQARAELDVIQQGVNRKFPQMGTLLVHITPLRQMIVGSAQRGLWLLLAAVLALLLIVCVNLANLLLARATGRRREMAIRGALGAGPGRLLRLALGETVVLALVGGAMGLGLAYFALGALLHWAPPGLPRLANVHMDGAVLGFTFGIAVLAGLLAGAWPAWRMARSDPQEALRAGGARAGEGAGGRRARELLAGLETALTAALLVIAGLLLASFSRVVNVPKGFNTQHLLTVRLQLPAAEYPHSAQRRTFWRRALAAAGALPGVTATAVISNPPLSGNTQVNPITVPGDTRPIIDQPLANTRRVSSGYLQMMGIPLLAGRYLTATDRGKRVADISASAARAAWPGHNPIGQQFRQGDPSDTPIRVVGVVGNTRAITLLRPPGLMVYRPHGDNFTSTLILRTALPVTAVAPELRRAVWNIDSTVPVPAIESMGTIVARSVAPRRFQMLLVSLFAAAALLLACLGIYGVVSYSVARRGQELGVRVALGARPADLYALVLWQGLAPVVGGLIVGLLGALALGQALASLLFEVRPTNPAALIGAAVILLAVAVAACWGPARRAVRANPVSALRVE